VVLVVGAPPPAQADLGAAVAALRALVGRRRPRPAGRAGRLRLTGAPANALTRALLD
jgi:hypothetical protein